MITVSDEFKDEVFTNDNRSFLYRAVITLASGSSITVQNEDLSLTGGVTIDESVCPDDDLRLGTCVVNKLTLTLRNYDGGFDAYDFMGATVTLHIGLMVDGVLEEFQRGVYYVAESPVYDTAFLSLVCYDGMIALDAQYAGVQATFPITVDNLVGAICTACSVTRESQTLPLASLSIPENQFSETATCREVLSYIAEINGMNCRFNNLGKLEFAWYSDGFLGEVIRGRATEDGEVREVADNVVRITYRQATGAVNWLNQNPIPTIYSLDVAKHDIVVTGIRIVIKTAADEDEKIDTFETGTSDYLVSVEGNPLITASNADSVLATLASNLLGFRYRKAMLSHGGMPWMMAGDSGLITDSKGVQRDIIISSTTFTAHERQSTVSAGKSPVTAIQYAPATRAYVSQMENIKPVINSLNAKIANANGLYETQQTTQGGATITYMHNKPLLAESDIQIMISDVGVMVTANGTDPTPTWYGLEVNGNLIANILSANGINADWINAGALVIYDSNNNELFRADKTGKIFRWNAENSQLSADGELTMRNYYNDQEGGDRYAPAFTSEKEELIHQSYLPNISLIRTVTEYGNQINLIRTWLAFNTESDYEQYLAHGEDESYAYDKSVYHLEFTPYNIVSYDDSGNTYLDFNWLDPTGYLRIRGRNFDPFHAYKDKITSNSNMNGYTTPGTYYCANTADATTVTNAPFGTSFQCCVYEWGSGLYMQIAWQNSSTSPIKYRVYGSGGAWGSWMTLQEGVAYKTGTVTIASGTQSTATQSISFSDVVPSGKTVYSVNLTLGSYQMPYVNSSGNVVTWISNLTNSAVTISNKTSAWSDYNYYLTVFYH